MNHDQLKIILRSLDIGRMNNTTGSEHVPDSVSTITVDVVVSFAFLSIALLSLVCNTFVLIVLKRGRAQFDDVMVVLFQVLALTDLIGGVTASVLQSVLYHLHFSTPSSLFICKMTPVITNFLMLESLFIVCIINICRYISITRPMCYVRRASVKRVRVAAALVTIGAVLNTLVILPTRGFPLEDAFSELCSSNLPLLDRKNNLLTSGAIVALMFISASFLTPVCLLSITNARLLMIAWRIQQHRAERRDTLNLNLDEGSTSQPSYVLNSNGRQVTNRSSGLAGLRTVFAMTTMFYISCIPFVAVVIPSVINQTLSRFLHEFGGLLSLFLLLSNAWWNAVIYMFTSNTFRTKAFEILSEFRFWRKN